MTTVLELLRSCQDNIRSPAAAAALFAEDGKIKLLREALDTAAAARAFSKD